MLGYAYASSWRPRIGYNHTVEDSLYIAPDAQRQGVGRALLRALIAECEALGFRQMVAVIGDSRHAASIALHAQEGFTIVGRLPTLGHKFGLWLDSVLMQRALGAGREPAAGTAGAIGFPPAQATTRRSGASKTRSTLARSWPRFRICPVAAISA